MSNRATSPTSPSTSHPSPASDPGRSRRARPIGARRATAHRRRRRLATLGAIALAASTVVVASPAAAATEVTGGTIDWGVRASFRNYIVSPIAHGSITVGGGASVNADGTYRFAVSGGNHDAAASTSVASGGSVSFVGHGGVLEMTISDVRVSVSGSSGELIANVVSRPFTTTTETNPPVTYDNVVLGALDLSGVTPDVGTDTATWSGIPVTLTEAGAAAFGGFYAAGESLDPVSFTAQLGGSPGGGEPGGGTQVAAGSMTWAVSQQVWSLTSLSQCRSTDDPATIGAGAWDEPGAGAVFASTGGTFDASTGTTELQLDGALIVGNRNQGNYRLRLADPTISVDAEGNGTLRADVSTSLQTDPPTYPTGECAPEERTWTPAGDDVVVLTFDATAETRVVDGDSVTWTLTAPWETAGYSFATEFIDSLDPSLQGHFRVTDDNPSSAASLRKPPAPIHLSFQLASEGSEGPSESIEIITTVEGGALVISVASNQVVLPTPTLDAAAQRLVTSGALGEVTVVDTRSTDPGWNISAQIGDFTGPDGGFAGTGLGWAPAVAATSSGQNVSAGAVVEPGVGLSGATLATADAGSGRGTASLGAGLTLHVPTETPPGTYSAVLTLTTI